mmetsp:Transcript_89230/g.207632  ORF Transcript_89230/g.207632 Transcript_89230/m.207632 type:complete len:238 (+) Transcript_89230:180-893(+)|eukprot:CAMPEP_0171060866 /NCGR_PEP_ID=MMETSP0766_2-20121228/4078_1 /TAXON_ID=439317 /ORGANISM="Gambierdiscus australes, Strain CAWD 149" /LENGTH=237 /DNA_ID=CAMNT_0011516479 /DNA_START=157 /DNA_END=870 /DNA_ORIENTATION=+
MPPHSTHLLLESGRWLCPELLVPQHSKCVVAVPVVAAVSLTAAPTSFMVIDKMGQALFKASALQLPKEAADVGVGAELVEHLHLTRHDGTSLATCQWRSPGVVGQFPECKIFQRDGLLFATLKRDSGQVSWLSPLLRKAPKGGLAKSFAFASASPGAWHLRVEGNVADSKFRFTDSESRTMATIERGQNLGFQQGGQEFFRVEVGSEVDTDLGLVTMVLLVLDRMLGSKANEHHSVR